MASILSRVTFPYAGRWVWTALAMMTLLNVISQVSLYGLVREQEAARNREYSYIDDDFPRELPIRLREVARYMDDYSDLYPINDTEAWHSAMPYDGWVRLGPRGRSFALSMYHQMHCLDGMRNALISVHDAMNKSSPEIVHMRGHAFHCFNLLRQNLLCGADTTLEYEGAGTMSDGEAEKRTTIDGNLHRCRDWTQAHRWVKDNNEEWKDIPRYEIEEAKAAQGEN